MPAHLICEEGPLAGLILEFKDKDEWTIGRDPDLADLVLEDSTVSRQHLLCQKTADGIIVKNLSTINPTIINDHLFEEPVLIKEGDRLKIGQNLFLFSEEEFEKEKSPYNFIFDEPLEEPKEVKENKPKNPYDTIFEDNAEEPELPFSLIGESPFILKVISGPNAGAEIGVEKSRSYIIGKDTSSCDIVFQDLSVSRNHARLTIEANGTCYLEDLDSKNGTLVNNVPIHERTKITTQDLISLGTTTLLLIDRTAAQETIYSPAPFIQEEEIKVEPAKELVVAKSFDWKNQIIPIKYLVLFGSLSVIVFVVFLSFFSLFKGQNIEIVKKDYTKELENSLAKFPGVIISYNAPSGKLFLSGHVSTEIDEQELLYTISMLPYVHQVESPIIIDEYVIKNVNELISSNPNWKSIRISAPTPGNFIVGGYLQAIKERDNLSDFLNINFPFTDRLKNQIVVEEVLSSELQSLFSKSGLDALAFQIGNGEVVITGRYAEEKASVLQNLIDQISKMPGIVTVSNYSVATSGSTARLDISTQYQVTGYSDLDDKGYSVVINGKIFMIGESLNGMKITDLETNLILLEKDGVKYKIEYSL